VYTFTIVPPGYLITTVVINITFPREVFIADEQLLKS
jgi:hypothetical protein